MNPSDKALRLERLYCRMRSDPGCGNGRMGSVFVPGRGTLDGPLFVLVGEAPGKNEEMEGLPFVGAAGKNLDSLLALARMSRREVFITNTIKYRPLTPEGGNRSPTGAERRNALPFLLEELEILAPKLVVCLGLCPARALLGASPAMAEANGKLFHHHGLDVLVTYHPSPLNFNMAPKRQAMETVFKRLKQYV